MAVLLRVCLLGLLAFTIRRINGSTMSSMIDCFPDGWRIMSDGSMVPRCRERLLGLLVSMIWRLYIDPGLLTHLGSEGTSLALTIFRHQIDYRENISLFKVPKTSLTWCTYIRMRARTHYVMSPLSEWCFLKHGYWRTVSACFVALLRLL